MRSKEKSFLFVVDNFFGVNDNGVVELKNVIEEEVFCLMLIDEEFFVLWFYFEEEIFRCREKLDCLFCVIKVYLKEMMKGSYCVVEEEEF